MDGEVTLLSRQRDHWNSRHRVLIDLQGEAIEEAAISPATLLPLQRWIEKVVEKEGGRIIARYPQ